jgi:hypothetical protein
MKLDNPRIVVEADTKRHPSRGRYEKILIRDRYWNHRFLKSEGLLCARD